MLNDFPCDPQYLKIFRDAASVLEEAEEVKDVQEVPNVYIEPYYDYMKEKKR